MPLRILFLFAITCFSCSQGKKKHSINPDAKRLHDSAVNLVVHNMDYQKAITLLNQAIQIDSNYFSAYNSKFVFLGSSRSADLPEFLKTLKKLIDLRPDLPDFYFYAGIISKKIGDSTLSQKYLDGAIVHYDKILDTIQTDKILREVFTINKGISLILLDQDKKGRDLLKQTYDEESNASYKSKINRLMTMSKQSLVDTLSFTK
jgi:tetratricopeptide (TPR) repeat protein